MRQKFRSAAVRALRAGLSLGGETARRIAAESLALGPASLLETVERVKTDNGDIKFYCIGELPLWRVRSIFTKEPETIEWIDSLPRYDVLWDIGANIGLYSIYAARFGRKVLAFEPSAANYILLNRNIELNHFDTVMALCVALGEKTELASLNMQNTEFGGALSSFGVERNENGERFIPAFRQGMIGYSIDDFVERFAPPFPNHIKIDVDGIEAEILAGAKRTLADERLKSVSIEVNMDDPDQSAAFNTAFNEAGLRVAWTRQSSLMAVGPYKNFFNRVYQR